MWNIFIDHNVYLNHRFHKKNPNILVLKISVTNWSFAYLYFFSFFPSYFKFFLLYILVLLMNNIILVSSVRQSNSVIHMHVSILFQVLFKKPHLPWLSPALTCASQLFLRPIKPWLLQVLPLTKRLALSTSCGEP